MLLALWGAVAVYASRLRLALILPLLGGCGAGDTLSGPNAPATSARPYRVRDIHPGSPGSGPGHAVDADGLLFFTADDGTHGSQLWRSDGTEAGTVLVADVGAGPSASQWSGGFAWVKPYLFFSVDDGVHGRELWRSDGTGRGTVLVKDVVPGPASALLYDFTGVGGTLFFVASTEERDQSLRYRSYRLFKSDGTADGTVLVRDLGRRYAGGSNPTRLGDVLGLGGRLYFSWDGEVWTSDGTAEGTQPIADGLAVYGPVDLVVHQGRIFFVTREYGVWTGRESAPALWTSDGTRDGTRRLREFPAQPPPSSLVAAAASLYFLQGGALWTSDGTSAGTGPVMSLPGRYAYVRATLGNTLLFSIDGALWRSDGTSVGSRVLSESTRDIRGCIGAPARVFCAAGDGLHGVELWSSDGTAGGTELAADLRPGPDGSAPDGFVVSGGRLFFSAEDGRTGRELWAVPVAAGRR